MKIEGLFLRSRAGRRIFWTLLAAATVPIVLLGVLVRDTLNDHFVAQAERQRVQIAKYAGMGLLDNLVVARTVLEILARTERVDTDSRIGNRRGRVLGDVAVVDDRGAWLAGSVALWRRWQEVLPPLDRASMQNSAQLVLGHDLDVQLAMPVLMVVRRADQPGSRWIAEVDSDFLFRELLADNVDAGVCVFDAHGHAIFCPAQQRSADLEVTTHPPTSPAAGPRSGAWNLFLKSDFGAADWTLVLRQTSTPGTAVETPALARTITLGMVVTLLTVVMLGLVQVRRTMIPLERLTAGTRRLAQRDFTARVSHADRDEFDELARSFNHMAEQLGRQVDALQVQSSIDREILNGLDLSRILQQVARRIGHLVPGAQACVVELDRAARTTAKVHYADGTATLINVPAADPVRTAFDAPDGLQLCSPAPAWLSHALRSPAKAHYMQCARFGGRVLAILVLGVNEGTVDNADTQREIDELRDRVCVALASAERERMLVERATRDGLTGLANRSGLLEHLERLFALPTIPAFSLLFIDLDRFKEVNDSLGHLAGDDMLREMSQRLRESSPGHALVARPGGDEFVVIVPGPRAAAVQVTQALLQALAMPLTLEGRMVVPGASIGLAHAPDDGRTASDLLRRADMAMYSAKAAGGGRSAWFAPTLDEQLAERTALLDELNRALERDEFELYYQPRVAAGTGVVRSAEALLRWRHPMRGVVPPARFIDLLEETGQIDRVGMWAIDTACRQLVAWRAQGLALDALAVNVSTRQLKSPTFVDQVTATLGRHALPASSLELEITESIFMGDSSIAIAAVHALSQVGIRIALDDFGTGYSSLSYLQKLPIGILKVDRSFVTELGQRDSALAVTRSIIALARALHLQVVAEGVETWQQTDLLVELGCDELQGYLFAEPLACDDFARHARRPAIQLKAASPIEA